MSDCERCGKSAAGKLHDWDLEFDSIRVCDGCDNAIKAFAKGDSRMVVETIEKLEDNAKKLRAILKGTS